MNITNIVEAAVLLLFAILEAFCVPLIKERISVEKRRKILDTIKIAVRAAEQIYTACNGAKKKSYVLQYLEDRGFKITPEIEATIEAEVLNLHTLLESDP